MRSLVICVFGVILIALAMIYMPPQVWEIFK